MKKTGVFVLFVLLLLVILCPGLVQARGGLAVTDNSAEAQFPISLSFSLSAVSDVDITDIRLHYTVDRDSFAEVTSEAYIDFVPDTDVDVRWSLDMRRIGGLPPESVVQYWWTLEDTGGNKLKTAPLTVNFNDERYSWESLTEGKVTIRWYEGNQSFAGELMSTAQDALVRLAQDTGAYLKKPVKLYIYADTGDLQGAMIFPQEWTGGVAYTAYGIIAIGIASDELAWGKTSIVHELTHLVIHQMTLNPYNDLPRWLDEGLAMYNEGLLEPTFASRLLKAVEGDTLISVRTLSSPFSTDSEKALLSYAQSYALVEYIIGAYGQSRMLELLTTFSQGSGYDEALENVYGFDMDGLDNLWREYIIGKFEGIGATTSTSALVPAGVSR